MSEARGELPQPGDVVDDRYQVGPLLSGGGMGLLYKVTDRTVPHLQLAMKVLKEPGDSRKAARLIREAEVLGRLSDCSNIARIHGAGRCWAGPYIVQELLTGEDLGRRLAREKRLGLEASVRIGLEVCAGLQACHAREILHRDVKPDNIFLHREVHRPGIETAKLLDFGISHIAREMPVTEADKMLGTRFYMAPEQMRGADNEKSDQFSFAVVLFQMLTGEVPWPRSPDDVLQFEAVSQGKFALLRQLRGELPAELEAIIARALSPDPEARFISMKALARQLLPFASQADREAFDRADGKALAPPSKPASGAAPVQRRAPDSASQAVTAPSPARRAMLSRRRLLLTGGGIAVAAAGALWGLRSLSGQAALERAWEAQAAEAARRAEIPQPAPLSVPVVPEGPVGRGGAGATLAATSSGQADALQANEADARLLNELERLAQGGGRSPRADDRQRRRTRAASGAQRPTSTARSKEGTPIHD
jgi:hypothetical protein